MFEGTSFAYKEICLILPHNLKAHKAKDFLLDVFRLAFLFMILDIILLYFIYFLFFMILVVYAVYLFFPSCLLHPGGCFFSSLYFYVLGLFLSAIALHNTITQYRMIIKIWFTWKALKHLIKLSVKLFRDLTLHKLEGRKRKKECRRRISGGNERLTYT